jgi:hypothetical protein
MADAVIFCMIGIDDAGFGPSCRRHKVKTGYLDTYQQA